MAIKGTKHTSLVGSELNATKTPQNTEDELRIVQSLNRYMYSRVLEHLRLLQGGGHFVSKINTLS